MQAATRRAGVRVDGLRHVLRGVVHLCMRLVAVYTVITGARLCLETWTQVIGQLLYALGYARAAEKRSARYSSDGVPAG